MRYLKKVAVVSLVAVSAFSGCSFNDEKDVKAALDKSFAAMNSIDSVAIKYDVDFYGIGHSGDTAQEVKLLAGIDGMYDFSDANNPKLSFKLDLDVDDKNTGKTTGQGEALMTDGVVYGRLLKVPDEAMDGLKGMVNKWYKVPLPKETVEKFAELIVTGKGQGQTEAEQNALNLALQMDVFSNYEDKGEEKSGLNRYEARLDRDKLLNWMTELSNTEGTEMGEAEVANLKEGLKNLNDSSVSFLIDPKTNYLHEMKLDIKLKATDPNLDFEEGELKIAVTATKHNEKVELSAPVDAEDLDLGSLMTGGGAPTDVVQ